MKNIVKITTLSLIAAALAAMPMISNAEMTNAPAASTGTNAAPVKIRPLPFHGKIASLDASAGTFSVGELDLNVTSTTKISTNGVPATLADFKIGDSVSGAYKKAGDGKLNVTTLRTGPGKHKKPVAQ